MLSLHAAAICKVGRVVKGQIGRTALRVLSPALLGAPSCLAEWDTGDALRYPLLGGRDETWASLACRPSVPILLGAGAWPWS